MTIKAEMEHWYQVFTDIGDQFTIKPDSDGLDLIELVCNPHIESVEPTTMIMSRETAELISEALMDASTAILKKIEER